MSVKRIGVLGSGQVGQVLAKGFLKHDYEVMIGTRDAGKLKDWQTKSGSAGQVGSFAETAQFGELLVLACLGTAAADVVELAGTANLNGKVVIDATNPIDNAPPEHGVLKFFTDFNESLMERLQQQVPNAHFVKAFSCVGNAFMVNPEFPDGPPTMFICGNSAEAKKATGEILTKFGWAFEDMGGAEAARAIEPLCILWCIPGFLRNEWNHAFKLIKQ